MCPMATARQREYADESATTSRRQVQGKTHPLEPKLEPMFEPRTHKQSKEKSGSAAEAAAPRL